MNEIKTIAMVLLVVASSVAFAKSDAPGQILIKNVQVFDGTSSSLSAATNNAAGRERSAIQIWYTS